MIINERYFKRQETGMSMYDDILKNPKFYSEIKNLKAKLVFMDPDVYIQKVARMWNQSYTQVRKSRENEKHIIDDLVNKLQQGVELDTPVINYKDKTQEGLHRALAALKLGIKVIPVIEIDRAYPVGQFHIPWIYDQYGNVKEYEDKWV